MWQDKDEPQDLLPILHKEAIPRDGDARGKARRFSIFGRGVVGWLQRAVLGYAWPQIDRAREAKLRDLESASEERSANAEAKRAEARKLDAEAERMYAEAEQIRLQNLQKKLTISEAFANLEAAMAAIRAKGGNVDLEVIEQSGVILQRNPTADESQADNA